MSPDHHTATLTSRQLSAKSPRKASRSSFFVSFEYMGGLGQPKRSSAYVVLVLTEGSNAVGVDFLRLLQRGVMVLGVCLETTWLWHLDVFGELLSNFLSFKKWTFPVLLTWFPRGFRGGSNLVPPWFLLGRKFGMVSQQSKKLQIVFKFFLQLGVVQH